MGTIEETPSQPLTISTERKPWQFQPGNNANPTGRPKGSRNKLGEDFVAAVHDHWLVNREAALDGCLKESPAAYCRVIAAIIPKELTIKTDAFEGLSDDEIAALVSIARTAIAASQGGGDEATATAH